MVNKLEELENRYGKNTPILVFSDYALINEFAYPIKSSLQEIWHVDPRKISLNLLLTVNAVSGCITSFNRALIRLAVPFPKEVIMHDWWLALVSSAAGNITFLPVVTTLYRQHASNAVGVKGDGILKNIAWFVSAPSSAVSRFKQSGLRCISQVKALQRTIEDGPGSDMVRQKIIDDWIKYRTGPVLERFKYFREFQGDPVRVREFGRFFLWGEE